ncbi:MAG: efflux RND transporter periplasmic adaptor subunit [Paracoccaceae bacterium]
MERTIRRFGVSLAVVLSVAALAAPLHAQPGPGGGGPSGPPAVIVSPVVEQETAPEFRFIGRIEAVESVDLRARVTGFLQERRFQEGGRVSKGDVLFVLEKEPYEAVVAQREAELASAEADLNLANVDYARAERLVERGVNSQETLDQADAQRKVTEAKVLAAEASLRAARLDLAYTEIVSPIEGRIGLAEYSVGDLVDTSSGALATVTMQDPIHAVFQVSEDVMLQRRKEGLDPANPTVEPILELADGTRYDLGGELDFLSPTVNRTTDTVTGRAIFPNPEGVLLPGQFVSMILRVKDPEMVKVVPQKALQRDAEGHFALVVRRDDTVEKRRVTVGRQVEQKWVIQGGLETGERVIVEGIQKVSAGGKVAPSEATTQAGSTAEAPGN